jgi:triosephosphate isomerase
MTRRMLAAGNWKMNGLAASASEFQAIANGSANATCDVLICPPSPLLAQFADFAAQSNVSVGAQDCHPNEKGAHTGDISAEMIADAGGRYVIVGHSERRNDHSETDLLIQEKAKAAWRAVLIAVICVGETETQRDSGQALSVVASQIAGSVPEGADGSNTVIAYEPVWAIGTGRTPSLEDIAEMHSAMRAHDRVTDDMRLLYGGSVKPANAAEIFNIRDVDGALVGGASLTAANFVPIVEAASAKIS